MKKEAAVAGHNNKDIVSVQMLRGIASFMVVMVHCFPFDHYSNDNWLRIISSEGHLGVQVFFIISGYIVPYSMFKKNYQLQDIKVFFAKRMIRIEPPYIASIILILLLGWSTTWSSWYSGPPYQPNWWNVLGHMGYLNAFTKQPWLNGVYWTLALELMYYIIIAVFYPLLTNAKKWILMLSFFTFLLLSFTKGHMPYYLLQHHTVFFMFGIALFLFHVGKINIKEYFILSISCLIVCYTVYSPIYVVTAILSLLFIQYVNFAPKILLGLGAISYSLYLTHVVIITRVVAILTRFIPSLPTSIKYTVGIVFCVLFAIVYYYIIERPFQSLSKKIGYKK